MKFAALVLAGGRSTRMGRDKAWLEVGGRPLIERQLDLLRALGATEVFVSGRPEVDYSALGCRVLLDAFPDAGPLAGIERGLATTAASLLLVLAVDLPGMEKFFLQRLLAHCRDGQGAIPEINGRLEPLVALYPRDTHESARQHLQGGNNAVHEFALGCERAGRLRRLVATAADEPLFRNWNTPGAAL